MKYRPHRSLENWNYHPVILLMQDCFTIPSCKQYQGLAQ